MRTAGIILAAGESRRMGRAKAFLPFRDGTFLSTLAETLAPFCSPLIAVFGFDGDAAAQLAPHGVTPVINRQFQHGMLTSLQAGLRIAKTDRILFTLVDHPAVTPQTVARLIATNAEIVIPRFDGKRGHPVLVSRAIADAFLREPETAMVRDVIDRNADRILYVDVNDPGIRDDVDDPSLYEALLAREAARF